MTDKEIIKCLRHCRGGDCEECKALGVCNATFSFHKNARDLINRQKAEIERLKENIDGLNIFTTNHIKVVRLQAIKEFAERLKHFIIPQKADGYTREIVLKRDIDNLVKEMTEVNENDGA